MRASAGDVTPASMVGLGEELKLTPAAIARGYLELVARAAQPGVGADCGGHDDVEPARAPGAPWVPPWVRRARS